MKENNVPVCTGQVGSDGPATPNGCLNSAFFTDPSKRFKTSEIAVVDYLNWQFSSGRPAARSRCCRWRRDTAAIPESWRVASASA